MRNSGQARPGARDAASAFGDRVRTLREQKTLTLEQLSRLSGVSRAMLSKIERGEKSPTIGVAKQIAHALGASFSSLVGDEAPTRRAFALVTKDQRQVFRDPETGFERSLLSPNMPGMTVEVVLHHLPANTSTGRSPPHPSGTGKHVVVSRGHVVVATPDDETVLNEGDCLYFEADVEHWFENRTSGPAEYYLIISAPPANRSS
ncbi:helix-turn-helix domain-containing protein [Inquilinus sp. Marseille-Q2685]|uniref:helix-turn-helix domain-containing protein n=1 Tax=Inquilinus sp. Marseille-Q2685 TaxID=2866581 RepID=UPI001CE3C3EF|nr:XRE family transcriptional regulator [Inquilinus sp. Marseille-Q2685]